MKRSIGAVVCYCFLAIPVWAQRGGSGHGGGGGGHAGFSGGGRMGGFSGGRVSGGFGHVGGGARFGGNFGRGGGQFFGRGGFRGFDHDRFRGFDRGRFRSSFGFGFYPGFYGGFYGGYGYGLYDPWFADGGYPYYSYPYAASYGYSYPYSGYDVPVAAGTAYDYAPPAQVIINQGYRPEQPNPQVRDYTNRAPAQSESASGSYRQTLYLIAFKSGNIRAALAYWAKDGTLHYVSMDGEEKRESLAAVDRELSERLNRERHVTFSLPR